MNSLSIHSDDFSWKRLCLLAQFYKYAFGRQLLIYGIVSLLFFILLLLPWSNMTQVALFTMIWTILPLLLQMAPISLAKNGDTRILERMIPARTSEKFIFLICYFFIVIPVTVYLLPELSLVIYKHAPSLWHDSMSELVDLHFSNPPLFTTMNSLSLAAGSMTCLYVVLHARHNRVLKGILSVFGVMIAVGILGALYGMTAVFQAGYESGVTGEDFNSEQMLNDVMTNLTADQTIAAIVTVIIGIYSIAMGVLVFRQLSKSNL